VGIELRRLALLITKLNRKDFTDKFEELQDKFSIFLKERNEND